jgi:hypothetical protein
MRIFGLALSAMGLSWVLSSCLSLAAEHPIVIPSLTPVLDVRSILWSNDFAQEDWQSPWEIQDDKQWGEQNRRVVTRENEGAGNGDRFPQFLRVYYPQGSASPTVHRETAAPLGGTQFYAKLGIAPQDGLRLSYYVRFSENFDFVKGGKLPGLYGGTGNNGGDIPDGEDGFSTRFMWRSGGEGEVYAYLPTSREHGTSIGRGDWSFRPQTWYRLEQEVTLNQPGQSNGRLRVWVEGQLVLDRTDLSFRSTEDLKIEGILFSTFFGGSDRTWATPEDVYADFAEFVVTAP